MKRHYFMSNTALVLLITVFLSACNTAGRTQAVGIDTPEINKPAGTNTPTWTAPADTSTPVWTVPVGSTPFFRAVHMDGNDATNRAGGVRELSPDYFNWLRAINANWIGLSAELHVDDSLDSTVDVKYSGVQVPAFTDDDLVRVFREFRKHGIHVYLTLNFDPAESRAAAHPVERWQMGCSDSYLADGRIKPEFWPWTPDQPDHERFVAEFWRTYTEAAVHFARLAQQEGVDLFSLGTETECLFRTRAGARGSNEFRDEIQEMVQAVRAVYQGPLTYDQHYEALPHDEETQASALWEDASLDIIGISAYFPLVKAPPTGVMSVEELESRWESIFKQNLIPLHERYPEKPILFTEFGYTASLNSPYNPAAQEESFMLLSDSNGNGLDDGMEVQANIYEALFNVMDRHPEVLRGAFLWGNYMASDTQWFDSYFNRRGFDIRWKLSETVVRERYCAWIGEECTSQPFVTATPWPTITPTEAAAYGPGGWVIYADELGEGWSASNYLSTFDLQSGKTAAEGQYSIEVSALEASGALKMRFREEVRTTGYKWLVFQLNPGTIQNISLSVTIFLGLKNKTYVYVEDFLNGKPPAADQWTKVVIPLSALNPSGESFDSFYFELDTQQPGTFYLDDIRLVGS